MKKIITAVLGIAILGLSGAAFAEPEVNQRLDKQGARIAQGEQTGQLTNHEAKVLKKKDRKIKKEIRADRAANGGKLTPHERRKINRQENHVSKKITQDKHNDVTK